MEYKKERIKQLIIGLSGGGEGEMKKITREELQRFTDGDLEKLAKNIGLDVEGTRDELIDKILRVQETIKLE